MSNNIKKVVDIKNGRIFYCKSTGYSESYRIEYFVINKNNKVEKILKIYVGMNTKKGNGFTLGEKSSTFF